MFFGKDKIQAKSATSAANLVAIQDGCEEDPSAIECTIKGNRLHDTCSLHLRQVWFLEKG